MNTIKLSAVHYQMLLELAKKKHIKPVAYLEELIEEIFNSKLLTISSLTSLILSWSWLSISKDNAFNLSGSLKVIMATFSLFTSNFTNWVIIDIEYIKYNLYSFHLKIKWE